MRRITIAAAAAAIAVSAGSMTAAKADSQPSMTTDGNNVNIAGHGASNSLASSGSAAAATTPTYFGAKLTIQSQPSNAENGQSCDENGGIPHDATCT